MAEEIKANLVGELNSAVAGRLADMKNNRKPETKITLVNARKTRIRLIHWTPETWILILIDCSTGAQTNTDSMPYKEAKELYDSFKEPAQ